jgi:transcriptional regulator with XRE-family HTH domain
MQVSEVTQVAPRAPKARNEVAHALGQRVRRFRMDASLTQAELASRAELNPTEVSLIERGGRELRFGTILKLAVALEIQPGELMDGIELDGTDCRYP